MESFITGGIIRSVKSTIYLHAMPGTPLKRAILVCVSLVNIYTLSIFQAPILKAIGQSCTFRSPYFFALCQISLQYT